MASLNTSGDSETESATKHSRSRHPKKRPRKAAAKGQFLTERLYQPGGALHSQTDSQAFVSNLGFRSSFDEDVSRGRMHRQRLRNNETLVKTEHDSPLVQSRLMVSTGVQTLQLSAIEDSSILAGWTKEELVEKIKKLEQDLVISNRNGKKWEKWSIARGSKCQKPPTYNTDSDNRLSSPLRYSDAWTFEYYDKPGYDPPRINVNKIAQVEFRDE